jgi:hypothetical protein
MPFYQSLRTLRFKNFTKIKKRKEREGRKVRQNSFFRFRIRVICVIRG